MIRQARQEDLPALVALEAEDRSHWNPTQLASLLEVGGSAVLVFVTSPVEEVLAYLAYRQLPDALEILNLRVATTQRRSGLATALIAHVCEEARYEKRFCLSLEVSEDNRPARALYQAYDFKEVGRRPRYYRDGSDAVLMDLRLVP